MTAFATTRWSLILRASASADGRRELEELCSRYQPAIRAYLSRYSVPGMDLDDLLQEFLTTSLESQLFGRADPAQGSFRAYLVTALRHFISRRLEHALAGKRNAVVIDIDSPGLELPMSDANPEAAFERTWAAGILQRAMHQLRKQAEASGRSEAFRLMQPFLLEDAARDDYTDIATSLGMRRNAVAVAVLRLRQRFQELVRDEVAQTVSTEAAFDAELGHLSGIFPRAHTVGA